MENNPSFSSVLRKICIKWFNTDFPFNKISRSCSGQPKGSFGSLSAENFGRNSLVSAERYFSVSVFLQKGLFLPKEVVSAERSFFLQKLEGFFAEINGHFCRKVSIFLQKQPLSAETLSFCRKSPFRFFRYICRNKTFWAKVAKWVILYANAKSFPMNLWELNGQVY